MQEMTNWRVWDQMRMKSLWSVGRRSSLGSWFQRQDDAWRKERLLTFREEEEGGRERVMIFDERVLPWGWTEIRLYRYAGWVVVRERILSSMRCLILSQCKEIWEQGWYRKTLGHWRRHVQKNSEYAEDGLVEYLVGCSRLSCSSQAWSARWRWQWYWHCIALWLMHRRRSGWNSGGRMARAQGGSVPSGIVYGEGYPLFSRLGVLGESRELPQRGPGRSPGRKRILAYFEGQERTLLFVLVWQNLRRGQFALSSPTPYSGGTCPPSPHDLRPWTYSDICRSFWELIRWSEAPPVESDYYCKIFG